MRQHTSGAQPGPSDPAGGRRRVAVAAAVALVLSGAAVPSAEADKSSDGQTGGYPTQAEVDQAREVVTGKAARVAAIRSELALANQRVEQAAVAAEQAAEAYNGARWRLQVAAERLTAARKDARQARRHVASQRDLVASVMADAYTSGSSLQAVSALVDSAGPEAVMDRLVAYQGATDSLEATLDRYNASASLAEVFERQAEEARAEQEKAAREAASARDQAAAAASSAARVAQEIADRKGRLIRALARAEGISAQLAEQRQTALEEIARQRAEREARRLEAARKEEERRRAEAEAKAAAAAAQAESGAGDRGADDGGDQPAPDPEPTPEQPQPPEPAPAPPGASTGGAAKAISFARAQLGEPYVWGAAGPSAWDCSGLTMRAWQAGGRSLPHYSVAQYYAGTPIKAAQLRPGDLVFWGTTNSPGSIHHVALYIGNGQIIHAPRTGRPVSQESMYYWKSPNFFVRP